MFQTKNIRTLASAIRGIPHGGVFMLIGHGKKNQFGTKTPLRYIDQTISKISSYESIPKNSVLLYFGDEVDYNEITIGVVFDRLLKVRSDIKLCMIQRGDVDTVVARIPESLKKKVRFLYTHNDPKYFKACTSKYGGKDSRTSKPCSNTKKWLLLHKYLLHKGISNIFVMGGGEITAFEVVFAKREKIPITYFPSVRKFMQVGDKRVKVKPSDSLANKVGPTLVFRS